MKNFTRIGIAEYIAPCLNIFKDTGNRLVAAVDPLDSVGIIDSFFPDASFFTQIVRIDRHFEKIYREENGEAIDYMTKCSPTGGKL